MTDIDLASLIGSRICHDLVNPIGAIGNGVELMLLAGTAKGPEMTLISESVENANARIRFFRIAFGEAGDNRIARQEIQSIMADLSGSGRLRMEWTSESDLSRAEVRLAFLAIQCLETAMPYGGTIRTSQGPEAWRIAGQAKRFKLDEPLWAFLETGSPDIELTPSLVQFALLRDRLAHLSRPLSLATDAQELALLF
jgi:histidine phosphotransferase ChpT